MTGSARTRNLPRGFLESDADRARLGEPGAPAPAAGRPVSV